MRTIKGLAWSAGFAGKALREFEFIHNTGIASKAVGRGNSRILFYPSHLRFAEADTFFCHGTRKRELGSPELTENKNLISLENLSGESLFSDETLCFPLSFPPSETWQGSLSNTQIMKDTSGSVRRQPLFLLAQEF